jgi:D-psicose/D-tagatose/L-ribulose 3-epimerase
MPKYGAHAFVWIDGWTTEKGELAIAEAGRQGFDFIEIPLLKPQEFDAAAAKAALDRAGIYATASLVLPNDAHMPAQPKKAKDFLISALDQLEAVGGTYLCGCIAYALGLFTGAPPTDAERQTVIEVLGEVAADAKKSGQPPRGLRIHRACRWSRGHQSHWRGQHPAPRRHLPHEYRRRRVL